MVTRPYFTIQTMGPNKWRCSRKKKKEFSREKENDPIPLLELFRFASNTDVILMAVSITACVIHGVCLPIVVILYADLAQVMVETTNIGLNNSDVSNSSKQCQYYSNYERVAPIAK